MCSRTCAVIVRCRRGVCKLPTALQVNQGAPNNMAATSTDDNSANHYETITTPAAAPTYEVIRTPVQGNISGTSAGGRGKDEPDSRYRLETAAGFAGTVSVAAAGNNGPQPLQSSNKLQKPSSSSSLSAAATAKSMVSGVSDTTSVYSGTATTLVDNALYDLQQ